MSDSCRGGASPTEEAGHLSDRSASEQDRWTDRFAEFFLDTNEEDGRDQGIAAQLDEIVLNSDRCNTQNLLPDRPKPTFAVAGRLNDSEADVVAGPLGGR